jgi:iron complex outermembrane receptor protein
MPEVAIQWDKSDNTMLYAKVSDSAKAGGFASSTNALPENLEYGDESALGFEAGLKSRLAGGTAEFNLAVFHTEFKDLQVNSFLVETIDNIVRTTPVITNAAKATSQGIEANARWAATDWLTLGGAVAFLDAEYDKFDRAPCNPSNATENGICDLSGQTLLFAPDVSGNVFADIVAPISNRMNFVAGVSLSYSDSYFTEGSLDPVGLQDSFTRIDARAGIAAPDERWSVTVIGKNLGDEAIAGYTQPFGTYYLGYLEPPRLIYLQAMVRFGN